MTVQNESDVQSYLSAHLKLRYFQGKQLHHAIEEICSWPYSILRHLEAFIFFWYSRLYKSFPPSLDQKIQTIKSQRVSIG